MTGMEAGSQQEHQLKKKKKILIYVDLTIQALYRNGET